MEPPYKKRKVDNECRSFKDCWTEAYFFVIFKNRPVCLIYKEVAAIKGYNIQRHYNSKHTYYKTCTDQMRKDMIQRLMREL